MQKCICELTVKKNPNCPKCNNKGDNVKEKLNAWLTQHGHDDVLGLTWEELQDMFAYLGRKSPLVEDQLGKVKRYDRENL